MAHETRRGREMARLVARWERSGLTQAAFARRIGMPVATFTWWRHRLRRAARAPVPPAARPPTPSASAFTEVVLAAPRERAEVEVVLRDGRVLRVPLSADGHAVRRLIAALEAPRC